MFFKTTNTQFSLALKMETKKHVSTVLLASQYYSYCTRIFFLFNAWTNILVHVIGETYRRHNREEFFFAFFKFYFPHIYIRQAFVVTIISNHGKKGLGHKFLNLITALPGIVLFFTHIHDSIILWEIPYI